MKKYKTKQREKLLSLLRRNGHRSFSAQALFEEYSDEGISLSAIYRNLAEMEQEGLICKVSKKGEKRALYQYVNPAECCGHIHLICADCEETIHLSKSVSQLVFNLSEEEFQFSINSSAAYLYGKCANCSQI